MTTPDQAAFQLHSPEEVADVEALASNPDFKNGVMAVDPATIAIAFRKFIEYLGKPQQLNPTPNGEKLFEGLAGYEDSDFNIHDVVAEAGGEDKRGTMNDLAELNGFDAPFKKPFDGNQIGVLSIVNKIMKWYEDDAKPDIIDLITDTGLVEVEAVNFRFFSDNDAHFAVYDVEGFSKPVVRITADPEQSNGVQNYMWVTEISPDKNPTLIEVFTGVKNTVDLISQAGNSVNRRGADKIASVTIPKLTAVEYKRDWEEIKGTTLGANNAWVVVDAQQAVRVSVDEIGAEAAAMYSMVGVMRGGSGDMRERVIIGDTGPMLVWFTEGESRLPICATITNQEAWQPAEEW